jgi:hypothetical protein
LDDSLPIGLPPREQFELGAGIDPNQTNRRRPVFTEFFPESFDVAAFGGV